MFVDMGSVDGLVNYNEISYRGPVNPSSYYKEGEVVNVVIKSYNKEKGHLSLSIKDAMSNPWDEIKEELEVGDTITVTVSNFESLSISEKKSTRHIRNWNDIGEVY